MIYHRVPFKDSSELQADFQLCFPSRACGVVDIENNALEIMAANELIRKLLRYNPKKRLKTITLDPWFRDVKPSFKENLLENLDFQSAIQFNTLLQSTKFGETAAGDRNLHQRKKTQGTAKRKEH